jgi:2-dehydro-3-deoxygalactonokinase
MTDNATLIAIDWGTSNLRASLLGHGGAILQTRSAAGGVMAVPNRQFAQVLQQLCGDWLQKRPLPMIASGMIGSRQGWVEAPYLDCPVGPAEAATQLTPVPFDAHRFFIAPGLRLQRADGGWDVMRGEETQLWGADLDADSVAVLPGTHSKWVRMGERDSIKDFRTFMTGELYGLLTKHSILGKLMQSSEEFALSAFIAGVRQGSIGHTQLASAIFATRTAGLMHELPATQLADFLSGILIGAEVAGALTEWSVDAPVVLVGDEALCQRYAKALELNGVASRSAPDGATTAGQWRLAHAAGLY